MPSKMSDTPPPAFETSVKDEGAVGLSDITLSRRRRHMLDLTNRLHATGVQLDIDLPQIAVIGSQSAGKSSLIESISGIKLPRASGTCTRCPTECRMSYSSGPWKCTISLRYITDIEGEPLKQVRNEAFGDSIVERSEVEERLRRAQRAILNPGTNSKIFLQGKDDDPPTSELTFSSNCVSVQISGPDVADLSFCDLPGLIASVGKAGNQGDVKLVEKLLVSYIEKPNCLILLTVACEVDFETQGAYNLAGKYDKSGTRTIGVLTKPDRIPAGDEAAWIPFITGGKEPLDLGWFCVKQPDTMQLREGISWAQARASEDSFFREKEPWCSLSFTSRQNLGTGPLVDRLSETLSDLIMKRLPELQDELEALLIETENRLRELPAPPSSDSLAEMMQLITTFSRDVRNIVEGCQDDNRLVQSIRPFQERLRRSIRSTAPNFRPFKRPETSEALPIMEDMCFLANEDEDVSDNLKNPAMTFYLDEVMDRACKARTRELPDNYPFVVTQQLIELTNRRWKSPTLDFIDSVHVVILEHMKSTVRTHFGRFGQGGLLESVQMIVMDHVKKCHERTKTHVEWLMTLEDRPFTLNTHYLSDYKDKFLAYYKGCRRSHKNPTLMTGLQSYTPAETGHYPTSFQESVGKIMAGLGQIGMSGVKPEDLPKLLPADPYETALNIMACVRAYFQVAYKRYADNVPLAVDRDFVLGIGEGLETALFKGIFADGLQSHQRCKELLQESPVIFARREELQKRRDRLEVARQELLELW